MEVKTCSICGEQKNVSEFRYRNLSKGTIRGYCKECDKRLCADYRAKNHEKVKAKVSEYKKKNRKKIAQWQREHRKNNRKKLAQWQREYRKKNNRELGLPYIKRLLGMKNPPSQLVDFKREQMKIYRSTKQLIEAIKVKQNENER